MRNGVGGQTKRDGGGGYERLWKVSAYLDVTLWPE